MKPTHKQKIFLAFLFIFSLFTIGIVLFERSQERKHKTEVLKEKLDAYTEIANTALQNDHHHAMDDLLKLFPKNIRLSLIDERGGVLFDNSVKNASLLENHAQRPEISQASRVGKGMDIRISNTNHVAYLYYAKRFDNHYIRVALPYDLQLKDFLKANNLFLYYILALFVVTLFLLRYASDIFGKSIKKLTAQEQERTRHEMTGNITHELKTPITGIRGCLETILERSLDAEKERHFIRNAYHQTLVLSDLIQDLGLLTKMEEASHAFRTEEVNLLKLIEGLEKDLEYAFKEKSMILALDIPEETTIIGNKNLLYAIFRNLADNAVRYAGTNTVVQIKQCGEDKNFYYFSFSDTGSEILDEYCLSRLFERFYRVNEGRTRDTGGSGLGLSIVKNAVLFHRGNISVKNRAAGGLEFLFSLKKFSTIGG